LDEQMASGTQLGGDAVSRADAAALAVLQSRIRPSRGITLAAIVYFRLAYRATHRPAPLPAEIPAFYRRAGYGVHWLLYALSTVQPIVGWCDGSSLVGLAFDRDGTQ